MSQKLFISIVSHNNDSDIINNKALLEFVHLPFISLLIRDNVASLTLKKFCEENNIIYSASTKRLGFGANNNRNYDIALRLGLKSDDWFVLMNPDILIDLKNINELMSSLNQRKESLFAINLYKDRNFVVSDDSLRYFPTLSSLINLFIKKPITNIYDKSELNDADKVDWAAGSFLIVKGSLYKALSGFNEQYFMYYEDVDFCYRAYAYSNQKVTFLKNVKAVHAGAFKNRNLLSPHFRWYIKSLFRFLFFKTFKS